MVIIKFLGGAKKIIGKEMISIEVESIRVNEILMMLRSMSPNSHVLNSTNLLIVVNGMELSLLGGPDAKVSNGDIISIVPVVHGGTVNL